MAGHVFLIRGKPSDLACDEEVSPFQFGQNNVLPLEAFHQSLLDAKKQIAAGKQQRNRSKPLIALSLEGCEQPSERLGTIVSVLFGEAERLDVDIVGVATDAATFAAAQMLRREAHEDFWKELSPELRNQARLLADFAYRGELALFVGAGVSAGAGLPLLNELLERLAAKASMSAEEQDGLRRLNPLDQAAVVEKRLGGSEGLSAALKDLFTAQKHSLSHALLAAMPVHEVVTTNYDQLFEQAWEAVARRPLVLPYRIQPAPDGWLLKLHGCVSHPQDIVLTRTDQIVFDKEHAALAGLVEALLITRHMLFVGFSLNDDNFHRIATAVRGVVRKLCHAEEQAKPFGTALVLRRNKLLEELWGKDLKWVGMVDAEEEQADHQAQQLQAARMLDMFLDYLVAQIPNEGYLLDDRYRELLKPEEQELRQKLMPITTGISPPARDTSAWDQIQTLLCRLGYRAPGGAAHDLQRKTLELRLEPRFRRNTSGSEALSTQEDKP